MKKFSHKKGVTIALVALAAVAIGTVGFSAWVITATNDSDTITASIAVGDIQDMQISVTAEVSNENIVFDADSEDTNNNLIQGSGDTSESLSFTYTIEVSVNDGTTLSSSNLNDYLSSLTLDLDGEHEEHWSYLSTNNYVFLPWEQTTAFTLLDADDVTSDSGSITEYDHSQSDGVTRVGYSGTWSFSEGNFVLTGELGFGWGTAIGSGNPAKLADPSDDNIEALKEFANYIEANSVDSFDLLLTAVVSE